MIGPSRADHSAPSSLFEPRSRPLRVGLCHRSEWVANSLAALRLDGFEIVAMRSETPLLATADVILLRVPCSDRDELKEPESDRLENTVRKCPHPLVALSDQFSDYAVWRLDKSGFCGAIEDASATRENIRALLQAVAAGQRWFSATFEERRQRLRHDSGSFPRLLTKQQENVLRCVAHGYGNEEIGEHLGCSAFTAKRHRADLMRKLDARDSLTLARTARRLGFADFGLPDATRRTSVSPQACAADARC